MASNPLLLLCIIFIVIHLAQYCLRYYQYYIYNCDLHKLYVIDVLMSISASSVFTLYICSAKLSILDITIYIIYFLVLTQFVYSYRFSLHVIDSYKRDRALDNAFSAGVKIIMDEEGGLETYTKYVQVVRKEEFIATCLLTWFCVSSFLHSMPLIHYFLA